jgi:hypothetical protein
MRKKAGWFMPQMESDKKSTSIAAIFCESHGGQSGLDRTAQMFCADDSEIAIQLIRIPPPSGAVQSQSSKSHPFPSQTSNCAPKTVVDEVMRSPSTSSPWEKASSLAEAIAMAKGKRLIIVEDHSLVDLESRNWLTHYFRAPFINEGKNQNPVPDSSSQILVYNVPLLSDSLIKTVCLFCFHLLTRALLGIRKSIFKPGLAVLDKSVADRVLSKIRDSTFSRTQPGQRKPDDRGGQQLVLEEFLSLAFIQGIPIVEIERSQRSTGSGLASSISLRAIVATSWRVLKFRWNQIQFPALAVPSGLGPSPACRREILNEGVVNDQSVLVHRSLVDAACGVQSSPAKTWWIHLVASCALLLLGGLLLLSQANYPLFEPDEARNAEISANLLASGQWTCMRLNGEPYRNKPPGLFWAIAISFKTFGFSSWATRLPSILSTLGTIAVVLVLGKKLVGFSAAFSGALILMLCCGFMITARYAIMDPGFTCCVVTTALALILAEGSQWRYLAPGCELVSEEKTLTAQLRCEFWLLLAGLAAGVGTMIKGPAILILTLPPVILAYALADRLSFFTFRRAIVFFFPLLLVSLPWYLRVLIVDPEFFNEFFWRHHVLRFSNAFDHEAPWWFYIPMIFVMAFPASYLFPFLAAYLFSRTPQCVQSRTPAVGFLFLAGSWIIVFFSCSHSKLPTYVLPALPFLSLVLGAMLNAVLFQSGAEHTKSNFEGSDARAMVSWRHGISHRFKTKWATEYLPALPKISPLGFVLMSVLIVVALWSVWKQPLPLSLGQMSLFWVAMAGVAILPWWMTCQRRMVWGCLAVTGFGLMFTLTHLLVPTIADQRSVIKVIVQLKANAELAQVPVAFFDKHPYGAGLFIEPEAVHYFAVEQAVEFCDFLKLHPLAIIVSDKEKIDRYCDTLEAKLDFQPTPVDDEVYISRPKSNWKALRQLTSARRSMIRNTLQENSSSQASPEPGSLKGRTKLY